MTVLQKEISEQRRANRQKVFNSLYLSKTPKTKRELSSELNLSFPTINQNVAELYDVGLIEESKSQNFTGGRHACVLKIVENSFYSVGISITDINICFILTNLKLEEVAYSKISYNFENFEKEIGDFLKKELNEFLNSAKINREKVLGVGIAVPALLDVKKETILISPTLKLQNFPCKVLTEKIPFKCFIENDATAGGFCEYYFSNHEKNMAYISLENGVGGSIIINGTTYLGDNVKSAEFGHICVENDGLECSCGKKGCLEAYCNAARFSDNLEITLEEFLQELQKGNKKYKKMLKEMLKYLAIAIGNIRIMLDCSVVIGGFLTAIVEQNFELLKEYTAKTQYGDNDLDFLSLCKFGNKSVCMGMSLHFVNKFISEI